MKKLITLIAVALLLGGLCSAGASDVLAAQSEALDLDGVEGALCARPCAVAVCF